MEMPQLSLPGDVTPALRLKQREYLLDVARDITAQLDLPTVLERVVHFSVELLGGRAGLIVLRREDGRYYVQASSGLPLDGLETLDPLLDMLPTALEEAREWGFPDLSDCLTPLATQTGIHLAQAAALPLAIGQRFLGMILVFRTEGAAAFSGIEQEILEGFADQAAIAIHNAGLYREARTQTEIFVGLYRSGLILTDASTSLDDALARVEELAKLVTGAETARILLVPPGGGRLLPSGYGEEIIGAAIDPITATVLARRQTLFIADVRDEPAFAALAEEQHIRTLLAVPILSGDEVLGAILVCHSEPDSLSHRHERVLRLFAQQSAPVIRNARLYEAIQAERERLATILRQSADGIVLIDAQGFITAFNPAMETMTGRLHDEVISSPAEDFLTLTNLQGIPLPLPRVPFHRASANPIPAVLEGYLVRKDGTRGPYVSIAVAPFYDVAGTLESIVYNVHNLEHLREAEELKSTFLAIISHELKTPVALVRGFADTLAREDATLPQEQVREFGQIIAEESDRLTTLIDNLLTAARVEAGGVTLSLVPELPLSRLFEEAVQEFQMIASRHSIRTDFPDDYPTIVGDPRWLRVVMDNLLMNAITYSPKGGDIRVQGWHDRDYVYVAVEDEGLGLSQEEQERIFERFYRAPEIEKVVKGTGLGLYVCRAIIEAHGGDIGVESEPGKGATFTLRLPLQEKE
jgi:PAS domain S-box-containing protein